MGKPIEPIMNYLGIYFSALTFLLGVLISALINTFISKDRDKQIRRFIAFSDAGREFSEAFIQVRDLLEVNPPVDPAIGNEWQKTYRLLQGFYKQHRAAVRKFEDIIPHKKRASFRECWNIYCCYDKNNNRATFSDYQSKTMEEELTKRHLATSRIDKLLQFTKIKT